MKLLAKIRSQLTRPKKQLDITIVGSCLSNFVVSSYLAPHLPSDKKIRRLTSALQLRSDIVLELLEQKGMDINLVERFLQVGKWGKNTDQHEYAHWFSSFVRNKCEESQNIGLDAPDLLVMDSLCDIRHSLYQHRNKGWRAFFGNIQFSDADIEQSFRRQFQHIGLLSAEEQLHNVVSLVTYFKNRNKKLRTVYMHFPLNPEYVDDRWIARSSTFELVFNDFLMKSDRNDILSISLPDDLNNPVTEPDHPNYSPQVWNHFYPETYDYFAEHLSRFLLDRNPISKVVRVN